MDIAFLFWAIAVGIILGAGFITLAVIGSVIIGLVIVVFSTRKLGETLYILVVNCDNAQAEQSVAGLILDGAKKSVLKSKSVAKYGIELTYEVRLAEGDTAFINRIIGCEGVSNAVLVTYNGEYMN